MFRPTLLYELELDCTRQGIVGAVAWYPGSERSARHESQREVFVCDIWWHVGYVEQRFVEVWVGMRALGIVILRDVIVLGIHRDYEKVVEKKVKRTKEKRDPAERSSKIPEQVLASRRSNEKFKRTKLPILAYVT